MALLVFGLVNTTQTVAQSRDFGVVLDQFFVSQSIGHYTSADAAAVAGTAVALSNVLCLVLAIGFAVPRMRAKRTSFWIPIICAVIGLVVTVGLILAALVVDPAFQAYVQRQA